MNNFLKLPEIDSVYLRVYLDILQLLELKSKKIINGGTNKGRAISRIDERGRRFLETEEQLSNDSIFLKVLDKFIEHIRP